MVVGMQNNSVGASCVKTTANNGFMGIPFGDEGGDFHRSPNRIPTPAHQGA